jgi:hypothetical protein
LGLDVNTLIDDVPLRPLEWQSVSVELDLRSLLEHVTRHPQDTRAAQKIVLAKGTPMQCVWFAVYARQADREQLWRHVCAAHNAFVRSQFLRYVPL